jgi:NhaA family Na+:H+ antiporter
VLALLGDRVPTTLKVFLTALAIVDDIGAVVIIALFYTTEVSIAALALGLMALGASAALNRLGTRNPVPYFLLGTLCWVGFLESGVHATIAAILMAFTIPARTRIAGEDFIARLHVFISRLRDVGLPSDTSLNTSEQQKLFDCMNEAIDEASAPLSRIEHALHSPVTFLVLPVFALANAGVAVEGGADALQSPIVAGIVAGLVVGKLVGVTGSCWLAVKLGIADLPRGVRWSELAACGLLAGIGFTMALFIGGLAFADGGRSETAKLGILTASVVAGVGGWLWLRVLASQRQGEIQQPHR